MLQQSETPRGLVTSNLEVEEQLKNYPGRSSVHTLKDVTPYLGLRARLSQVWINRWTILLLLVLVRTLLAITSLNHDLDLSKKEALSACTGVESMGSALASMPHYLSAGVNEMAANGVEKAVHGLMSMLLLTVTGVEEMVVFYINMITSTYLCLITFAVGGSLHAAVTVAEDVTKFLNSTLGGIESDIQHTVSDFQSGLNGFIGGLNSIPSFLGGGKGSIPTINIDGPLSQLNNIQLPSGIDEGLNKLNASIPDFTQVQNFTDNVIRLPFENVKTLINGTMSFVFDRSVFPVPEKQELTFCSDNNGISDFFDSLYSIADIARKVFIGLLITAAILCCIPMTYQEIRRWRTMQQRALLVTEHQHDPLDVVYIVSRPYTAQGGIYLSRGVSDTRKRILTRWVVAYATTPQALFVLSLAVAGLFSCLCQYILLRSIAKEAPALAATVGAFADKVVDSLNDASESWANGTNTAILATNDDINHNVFGWVNTTTGALNDTLNAFVDETTKVLNDTFGGTVLYTPIMEVLNCLIGLKIAGIEKGLTWVSDNAHIDLPLLPNDTFSVGAAAALANSSAGNPSDSFLASNDPSTAASDKITTAVASMLDKIADAIRTEALLSTAILCLWLFVVLCGVLRALYLSMQRTKLRGEGGPTTAGDVPTEEVSHFPTEHVGGARRTDAAPAYESGIGRAFAGSDAGFAAHQDGRFRGEEERWENVKLGNVEGKAPVVRTSDRGRESEYGFMAWEKK